MSGEYTGTHARVYIKIHKAGISWLIKYLVSLSDILDGVSRYINIQ